MYNHNISKSTKRRRFLEELETVNFLIDDQPELGPQPCCSSHEIPFMSSSESSNNLKTESNILNKPLDATEKNNFVHGSFSITSDSSSDESICHEINMLDIFDEEQSILNSLAKWTVNYSITSESFSSLLKILKGHSCFNNFPVDSRTILKTNKKNQSSEIQTIHPGLYYHFGIENGLKSLYDLSLFEEKINLVVGIDGLPLTKSSSSTFWPILGYARYPKYKPNLFIIGLYWGKEKPKCSNLFLNDMVDELKRLSYSGMITEFGTKFVVLDLICCDLPARSFVTRTKNFNGYSSCSRCTVVGERINFTTSFLGTIFCKRTHSDFLNRTDDDHHVTNDVSILTEVPYIDMVTCFSLDYMHLGCLGVMKKLILLWLGMMKNASVSVRLQNCDVTKISNHLLSIKSFITSDFPRKTRGLNEILRFKATEFKFMLVYVGPIVLKGVITDECYSHFLCLHVAFRILLSPHSSMNRVEFAEKLLVYFVETFEELYGAQFSSLNIHGLIHLADDYRKYGALDNCSCFPFENFMKFLKKMVRKHEKPLEQVINRYQEFITFNKPLVNNNSNVSFKKEHSNGPLTEHYTGPQFQILIKNNLKINTKSGSDVYIGFKKQNKLSIFKILNICHDPCSGKNVFLSKSFTQVEPFFDKPINSLKLGIAKVGNLSKNFTIIDIETEFSKYMIMHDYSLNHSIAYPIIHTYYE
ncbi:unnamed protein product [Macrosiphum euphorbiae]|uniref:DUF4218 domain-containing protein n=1 Tax=Macrosiphum euphorbiae TaxID=13131 RepID=A0AAV0XV60_9HEMI|nr:unnamed protein product [Macrosiphum euphorbiae]